MKSAKMSGKNKNNDNNNNNNDDDDNKSDEDEDEDVDGNQPTSQLLSSTPIIINSNNKFDI